MQHPLVKVVALCSLLVACATMQQSGLKVAPEVRKSSQADAVLFRDLQSAVGGVGFMDQVVYPDAKERVLVRIEVTSPDGSDGASGAERWFIQHDGADTVSYLVTFTPDGRGGTFFAVEKERQSQ